MVKNCDLGLVLLVLTYSKLHSKSCDYVYLFQLLVQ